MTPALIAHSKPWITDADIQAAERQMRSGMVGQGTVCRELERRIARWVGAVDGVCAGSGTAALVLALKALEVRPNDEVVLPTYVCVSVYEAVLTAGARPVLCDVGCDWVITAETVSRAVTAKTRAVIVPHIYGIFADVRAIRGLGIPVVEDFAQAVPAESSCVLEADIAVFSFHPTKCLTAGEGGAAVSSNSGLIEKMRHCRDGGGLRPSARLFSPLSDLSASLAIAQLARFPEMLEKRRTLALKYWDVFQKICPRILNPSLLERSMFFRFPVLVEGGLGACHDRFLERGIIVRQGIDLLLHRCEQRADQEFPSAVRLFERTVSLPLYPALTPEEESRCLHAAEEIFTGA